MNEQTTGVDSTFLTLLQQHRSGGCLNDVGQAIRNITDLAQTTGKPGGFTLKFVFDPTRSGAVEVADDLKIVLPKSDKETSLFFVGENGSLQRNNPNQLEMPLRSIEGGAAESLTSLRQVTQ